MTLVESGLNIVQVSLMSNINIEKMHFGNKTRSLNSEDGLNVKWS